MKFNLKLNMKTMAFKIWLNVSLFSAGVLFILWLLQTVFLNNFYEGMKKRAIVNVAETIADQYGQEDFESTIDQLAFQNAILIYVTDRQQNIIYSSDEHGFGIMNRPPLPDDIPQDEKMLRPLPREYPEIVNRLEESGESSITYTIKREANQGQTLVYGAWMGDLLLYISTPLMPVNSTVEIIRTQLIYVMILALLISSVIALFLARRLSKPIEKITETAGELGKGNYEIHFEKGCYEEADNLASALNHATKELSKVEDLRRELIANISHDFRTPLTMIKSYAELIRDISGEKKEKREIHLNVIIEESERLSLLVNDILNLSVIQQSESDITALDDIDLSSLLRKVLNRFKLLEEHQGYKIKVNIENNLYVLADGIRMEQVFYNLIGNGLNYVGEDKKLFVSLVDIGGKVRFEVQDRGDGIAEEEQSLIWERYYKSKTHKRAVISTGLGLSIVKGILEMHQAEFGVISILGKGSTFWFEINK